MEPLLLVVDDQASILKFLRRTLEQEGYAVLTATRGSEALRVIEDEIPDLVLLDLMLPDMSGLEVLAGLKSQFPAMAVVMMTAYGDVATAVKAMRAGAFDYITKPFNLDQLLVAIQRGLETSRAARELQSMRRRDDLFKHDRDLVPSRSPAMSELYGKVRKIAAGDRTTILIEGESGVGKEVVANLIHDNSGRREQPFLELNCAALPEKLLESEIFGHERGAFTDAVQQKAGLLELAHRGTLFLDEIGEMSIPLQVKLLRILEKQTFRRVGGVKDITVDVRIISATNRDLSAMVSAGAFREDLYYRLKVVPLTIPPLRDRPEDIVPLAEHYLALYSGQFQKRFTGFTPEATASLRRYPWPGNIRELKNVIERAALLEDGERLDAPQLGLDDGKGEGAGGGVLGRDLASALFDPMPDNGVALEELLNRLEYSLVRKALALADGNQTRAARLLGLNRDKLRYRLKTHGIS